MENSAHKFHELLVALEQLSEDQHGMLVGGLAVISGNALSELQEPVTNTGCTNNCNGGNCVQWCGGLPNGNC